MTADLRPIDELIGVYNADGGLVGELRYVVGKVLGRTHCALCDLTHGSVSMSPEWKRAADRISTPIVLLHLNERPEDVRRASDDTVPCVLARVGDELVVLLGPDDLEACEQRVDEFERRIRDAAAARGMTLG